LVEIASELYDFGVSDAGDTFGVPRSGPKVVRLLRGGKTSLRGQLAQEFFRRTGKAAPQQALADALLVIEGVAQDGDEQPLALRVAQHDGALWLDLGDATGRAVRITPDGWTVVDRAPVLFKRTALNAILPEPVPGGRITELWNWLNVDPADRPLVAAALVATLYPDIPHPVLSFFGEQGTGKSTAVRVLISVLDPSPVPLRKPPRDADSWVTAAAGSWVVGLDNLSEIPAWLSDSMCRAVTGDGDVRRRLYTDGDLAVFAFRRCLVINGIDVGAIRGDLAERMLPINLHTISERNRREEGDLWPAWDQVHPRLLGAVLDLAAGVAGVLPSVRLERKPRMADFARILAAVDSVLDTDGLNRFLAKQGATAVDTLSADPFITAMKTTFINTMFEGTAADLLAQMPPPADVRLPKGWPTTPRQVTQVLKRQAPTMRKAGWEIHDDDGANRDKVLRWSIAPPADLPEMAGIADPQHPRTPQIRPGAGVAGLAGDQYGPSQDEIPAIFPDFIRITGPGRCAACGLHEDTQGHRDGCPERHVG
ncbi:MAG: hypothetical protein M3Q22_04435, partial [Actinomycetota bacterium]|nr:hypothetical protein [Actinomycetota bacterium]